jgi:hypothetical protein
VSAQARGDDALRVEGAVQLALPGAAHDRPDDRRRRKKAQSAPFSIRLAPLFVAITACEEAEPIPRREGSAYVGIADSPPTRAAARPSATRTTTARIVAKIA